MASLLIGNSVYSPAVHPMETFSVWFKREWGSPWHRAPYMIPMNFEEAAFPSIGSARVRWEYGAYVNRWYHTGGQLLPVNLENWLIKIVVHSVYGSYIGFIGQVIGETMVEEGLDVQTGLPVGYQELECADISVLLRRRKMLGTFVGDGADWRYLKRTRGFNVGQSHMEGRANNRSLNYNSAAGCYMFEGDGADWSNYDIAEYALACFQPWYPIGTTVGGVVELVPLWRLSGQVEALRSLYTELRPWGREVHSLLDQMINRRRGFGAHVVTDGEGPIYLEVYSLSEYSISGLGGFLPANPRQGYVPVGGDHHIQATYQITEMRAVDEIVVESDEPVKVMASWTHFDGSLERGWTEEREAEYIAATDEARASDYFASVYSKFQVPKDFSMDAWVPAVDDFGQVHLDHPGNWWNHDMGVERYLPIEEDGVETAESQHVEPIAWISTASRYRDLSVMLFDADAYPYNFAGAAASTHPPITEAEFEAMSGDGFVITLNDLEAAYAAHPFHWFPLHRARALALPNCTFQPGDTGLSLYVRGAELNTLFALNRFTGTSAVTPLWDYKSLIATMFFRTDEMLRVRLPVWTGSYIARNGQRVQESNPQGRQIHIVVPGQECWVAAPWAVVDVDDGELVYHNTEAPGEAAIIRNDIARIRWTALVAYAWYGTPRATVRLTIQNHLPWFRVGDLIRATVSGYWWERIGTCVTSISHDCESCIQTVVTAFGEIDPEVMSDDGRRS